MFADQPELKPAHQRKSQKQANNTVDPRYLEIQGTLWNTSRYPYFDKSDLRTWEKQLMEQPPLTEWICNLTPKLERYWKHCGKEEKLQFLFSTIFCCLLADLCVKTGTRFSLRDKWLFEISEVEITRVDCTKHSFRESFSNAQVPKDDRGTCNKTLVRQSWNM